MKFNRLIRVTISNLIDSFSFYVNLLQKISKFCVCISPKYIGNCSFYSVIGFDNIDNEHIFKVGSLIESMTFSQPFSSNLIPMESGLCLKTKLKNLLSLIILLSSFMKVLEVLFVKHLKTTTDFYKC